MDGGVITPIVPVEPSGPMAANVRVVSDPQGGNYVSELSCIFEASETPGGGSNPIVITVNWDAPMACIEVNPSYSMAEHKRLSRRTPRMAEPLL